MYFTILGVESYPNLDNQLLSYLPPSLLSFGHTFPVSCSLCLSVFCLSPVDHFEGEVRCSAELTFLVTCPLSKVMLDIIL